MMKKVLFLCLGAMGLSFLSLQRVSAQERIMASKHHITRAIEVGSFDHIQLNGSSEIIFTPTTGHQHLNLTLPDNLQDVVQVYVKNRTLVLQMKSNTSVTLKNGCKVELQVSAPMVKSVTLNGSGNISFSSHAESRNPLNLTLNGSGDIDVRNIKATSLTATVNGSGDIHLGQITSRQVQATVNGSGDLTAAGVKAERTMATVNGSGDLECYSITAQSVDGAVRGSGDLQLGGSCETANYVLAGSGDISAAGLKAKQVIARTHGTGDIHCHASESIVMTQKRHENSIIYTGNPKHVERNEL